MVRLNALGQSAIEIGEVRLCPEQPYLFAIALYLIVERGKKIPRNALVELMWPNDKDEKHARQRFRQNLLRLREVGLPVSGENGTLLLDKNAAQADFETITSSGAILPGQSLEFLPHYAPKMSERFLDWVDTHRSRVHASVQRVFLVQMQQARSRGDWGEVESLATECLKLDPYNEETVMAQAECAVMRGSKREALGILDTYMEALGSHVGTIGLPAKILRTRIAERLTDQRYAMLSEQHFVGRESSMEFLLNLLREAQRGSGSAAFIWGEPGIGKSRLVHELTQVAALEGAQVVSTKCHPADAGRPLSAFADVVPVLRSLPGALGCSAQTLTLLQRLTDRNKNETLPDQQAGDAAFLAATIRRAVFDLLDAVADEGMLVVIIEDVHWLDERSWEFISDMIEWATTRTLLILLTSRSEHAGSTKKADPSRGFHRHPLPPLPDADSTTLLGRLALEHANSLPEKMCRWSVAAAEGNPYYLRELVRHWVETQQSFGVPTSLAELIDARLTRLSSLALRVLQLCAAFGKHASFGRLEQATGYQNHVLLDAVEELSEAGMLVENAALGVKHDLLSNAALSRLGGPARGLVHRQVAAVLETEIKEKQTAALMWSCAEHWQYAGETKHALTTATLCAEHLLGVGQVETAITLYENAIAFCTTPLDRRQTLLALATSLKIAGRWGRLRDLLAREPSESITEGEATPDDSFALLRLEANWRLNVAPDCSVTELLAIALDGSKQPSVRLNAAHLGLIICVERGRKTDAHEFARITEELAQGRDDLALISHIRMIFHADFGSLEDAAGHAETLLSLETASGNPASISRTRTNVAYCYRKLGRIQDAQLLLRDNFAFASEHQMVPQVVRAATALAMVALQEEDMEEAALWHGRAAAFASNIDERTILATLAYMEARIGLCKGDLAPAREFLSTLSPTSERHHLSVRLRQTEAAIKWHLQLGSGEKIDPAYVEAIAAEFEDNCSLGFYDFFAVNLYHAMVSIGQLDRGARLLRRYINRERRDRGPLAPSLAAVAAQLGEESAG